MGNKIFNKELLAYILIGLVAFGVAAVVQSGAVSTEVRVTSTDNSIVQAMTRVSRVFRDTIFEYHSLPFSVVQLGNKFETQLWFQERYQVNGTYEIFEHGPFLIGFDSYNIGESIIIELNQENVTISCIG